MNTLLGLDYLAVIIVIVKISLMIFTLIHLLFLMYILKQVHSMKELLSTFNQLLIEGLGITQIIIMIMFLIYLILLP
jgi:hypothetical protein